MGHAQYERVWARGSRTLSVLALTHPTGVLVFGASTFVLCLIAQRGRFDVWQSLRLTAAFMCAQAANGVANDLFDMDLDRAAKPWRALPARLISVRQAQAFAAGLALSAIAVSTRVSPASGLLLACGMTVGVLYSARLKRTWLSWLPYLVTYPSLPVWVWVSTGVPWYGVLPIYIVGGPLVFAIHLVNQLRDFDEDQRLGVRSVVHVLGRPVATAACLGLMAAGPIPLVLTRLLPSPAASSWLVWVAALAHWLLVVPPAMRLVVRHQVDGFRHIFQAVQLSAPLLMAAWLLQA